MFDFDHPNITRLEMTFQDQASLFFLLEYAPNGSLAGLIKREKRLELDLIKFYSWEIVNALENMRKFKVVHRDLKPENILLDDKYHLKISDFGDAKVIDPDKVNEKILNEEIIVTKPSIDNATDDLEFENNFDDDGVPKQKDRGESFVGTPLYVTPEMLNNNIAWYATDLWAFGWILYQMATGTPPFNGFTENQIYDKIWNRKLYFPDFLNKDIIDLIDKLLQLHPKDRLGSEIGDPENNIEALKSHPFFKDIKFENIHLKPVPISKTARMALKLEVKAKESKLMRQKSDESNSSQSDINKTLSEHENIHIYNSNVNLGGTMIPSAKGSSLAPLNDKSNPAGKNSDHVIKETVVEKRNKWYFYQNRTLKLTKDLKLSYYNSKEWKEIKLTSKWVAKKTKVHYFEVITSDRSFLFRCKQGDSATEWVQLINTAIKTKYEKKKK